MSIWKAAYIKLSIYTDAAKFGKHLDWQLNMPGGDPT